MSVVTRFLSFFARHPGRRLAWGVSVLALLALLMAVGVPWGLRRALQAHAPEWLGRPVQVETIRFNPFLLRLRMENLDVVAAHAGEPPQLHVDELSLSLGWSSLWHRAPVVRSLVLKGPRLNLSRTAEGHYDVDDLLQRWQAPADAPASSGPARFALYNLQILDGQIDVDDRPLGQRHHLSALTLGVPFISTLSAADEKIEVQPRLAFVLDGSHFDTGARLTPFDPQAPEQVHVRLPDLDLAHWVPYLPASLPLKLQQGHVALDLALGITQGPQGLDWQLSGQVGLKDFALQWPDQSRAVAVQAVDLRITTLAPRQHRLDLAELQLKGLRLATRRDERGHWDWLALAGAPTTSGRPSPASVPASTSATGAAAADAPAWAFSLDRLTLEDTQISLSDALPRPAGQWTLSLPSASVQALRWPLADATHATRLQARGALTSGDTSAPSGEAQVQGALSREGGRLDLTAKDWRVEAWQPYLAAYLQPRLQGSVSAQAQVNWQGAPGAQLPTVQVPELSLDGWKVIDGDGRAARTAAAWDRLVVQNVTVDGPAHAVKVEQLRWTAPQVQLHRDAQGGLDLARWIRPQPASAGRSTSDASAEPAWQMALGQTTLEKGRLQWRDEVHGGEPVQVNLDGLGLRVGALQWPAAKGASVPLQGELRWLAAERSRRPGSLRWQGQLGMEPWGWKGQIRADQLPLSTASAYLDGGWPVSVDHAQASARLQTRMAWGAAGLSLGLQGEARLNDFRLNSRLGAVGDATAQAQADELMSWQSLALTGLDIRMAPGQAPHYGLGQVSLSDFFARLVVTEQGRLNLNDLAARRAAGLTPAEATPAGAPVGLALSAAPVASAASAVITAAQSPVAAGVPAALAPQIVIGGVDLLRGRIDFEDHFIRPNYRADLTELNGHIGGFSSASPQMAAVQLSGRAAGTAQLAIQGTVNPLASPLAMDLQARASDLELAPLSPYAGKYAGYAIERGKLTMDVAYRIDPDGKLQARNQIILNQLTFGDKIDSPDATKLPVLLAVALLKDRNGVIDLDLPISGSINDPQFSIGGLIVKVIVNLLVKAITAPFALLTGGGGPDLSQVAFLPGTATLAPGAEAALDKVAKALQDRPGLRMTVTGTADLAAEHEGLQAAWVQQRVLAEQRRLALREGAAPDAPLPALDAATRDTLLKQVYADTKLPDKPRNVLGLAKDIPVAQMEALLRKAAPVNDETARQLALDRGIAVRDALLARGLPSERLFLAAPKAHAAAAAGGEGTAGRAQDSQTWQPSAQLSLDTR